MTLFILLRTLERSIMKVLLVKNSGINLAHRYWQCFLEFYMCESIIPVLQISLLCGCLNHKEDE
jgi:hypothetical protein